MPGGEASAEHRRFGRVQRQPAATVEDRAGQFRHRDRPGDHGAAPATGDEQVEPGRTPAVLGDSDDLAGRPLESHEVVIETISAVTTKTGLRVRAMLDTNTYTRGHQVFRPGHGGVRGPPPGPTRLSRGLELRDHGRGQPRRDTPEMTGLNAARVLSGSNRSAPEVRGGQAAPRDRRL